VGVVEVLDQALIEQGLEHPSVDDSAPEIRLARMTTMKKF
jgi:hypothetical protein